MLLQVVTGAVMRSFSIMDDPLDAIAYGAPTVFVGHPRAIDGFPANRSRNRCAVRQHVRGTDFAALRVMAHRRSRDEVLLEGPHSRRHELSLLFDTVVDFLRGFRALHFVGPCVTVFGSARFGEEHPAYARGRLLGRRIAELGFTVMTGGGPGLMEAANRGAKDAGGRSVGCNIVLPVEQSPNPYLDRWVTCRHFFVRKVLLFKYSYAFVALPGGVGTMDEVFEALTLVQTRKIDRFPIVLIGTTYWSPLRDLLQRLVEEGAMAAEDLQLLFTTDDVEEAAGYLQRNAIDRFALRRPTASRWLGEWSVSTHLEPHRS